MSDISSTRVITINAIIAAFYVVATTTLAPISYGAMQFRLAEVMMLLPFYNRKFTYGIVIGCAISNIFSPMGIVDILVGTSASLLVCLGYRYINNVWIAVLFTSVATSLSVGTMLYTLLKVPPMFAYVYTGISEMAVLVLGAIVFKALMKNKIVKGLIIDEKSNI